MKLELISAVLALCAVVPVFAQEGDNSIGQRGVDFTLADARESRSEPTAAKADSRRAQRADLAVSAAQLLSILGLRTVYDTSTHQAVVIEPRLNHVRVRYGTRVAVILRPDGHGHFVSRDGQMSLQVAAGDGENREIKMTVPADWQ